MMHSVLCYIYLISSRQQYLLCEVNSVIIPILQVRKLTLSNLPQIIKHSRVLSIIAMIDSRELSYARYHITMVKLWLQQGHIYFFNDFLNPKFIGQSNQKRRLLSNILHITQKFENPDFTNLWSEMHIMQSSQEANLAICIQVFNKCGFWLNNFISRS